jgi:hypothetical protein
VNARAGEPGEWEAVDAGPGSGVQCGCCHYTVRHYWVHRRAHGIRCIQCAPVDDPYRAWLRTDRLDHSAGRSPKARQLLRAMDGLRDMSARCLDGLDPDWRGPGPESQAETPR